jgi:plastocyanin
MELLVFGAIAYVIYRKRHSRLLTGLVNLAALVLSILGGLILVLLVVTWAGQATLVGKLALLVACAAAVAAWWARRRAAASAPERVARVDRTTYVAAFALYASAAVVWLLIGLVPALASAIPSFERQLRVWGRADSVFGDMSLQAARASRNASSTVQVVLDYAFSSLNLALAVFLVVKVRGNRTANLLAIGMVGTAVAFNLQSHSAVTVIGDHLGDVTQIWHDAGVHVLAGIAYVFALLLFPDGAIDRSRGPHLMGLAVFFGLFSFIAIEDHTSALVLLFGVLVPAAALVAQSRRFRDAQSPELRQLFRLLRAAMGLALAGAVAVLAVTSVMKSRDDRFTETTLDYEVDPLAAGSYTFYCDPHIDDMHGTVVVSEDGPSEGATVVDITASGGEFDKDELQLVAGRTTVIRFTNTDGDEHNVAIYEDESRREALFIGELFSGQDLATFTFRVFRFVFAIIPVALFVAILRFHLWDVDRLVNRAMVYGALTGVLGLAYGVGALIVGLVPGRLFNQTELVAASVVAAGLLFRPVRRRLQGAIDRRFYREKLDTIRTLETFAVHVRDQVDLDDLSDELVSVVSSTMHPTQVTLWIREAEGAPGRDEPVRAGP